MRSLPPRHSVAWQSLVSCHRTTAGSGKHVCSVTAGNDFLQFADQGRLLALIEFFIRFTKFGNNLFHSVTFVRRSESLCRAVWPINIPSRNLFQRSGGRHAQMDARGSDASGLVSQSDRPNKIGEVDSRYL